MLFDDMEKMCSFVNPVFTNIDILLSYSFWPPLAKGIRVHHNTLPHHQLQRDYLKVWCAE